MSKIRLSQKLFYEHFDVATSHREATMDFAEGLITGKEWLEILYEKPSKAFAKKLIKESGVKGARRRLSRVLTNMWGSDEWRTG